MKGRLGIRPLKPADYALLAKWWKARKFPAPDPHFLPPTGYMISWDGYPVCAGFLFKSDANAAIIGHLVSDPTSDKEHRSKALDHLLLSLTIKAKLEGFDMVCCSTNLPHVMGRFEEHGFTLTDEAVSHFGKAL